MTSKVSQLLNALGLEKYQALFDAQEIDDEVLPELTAEDLAAIGLPLGPRKKLLKAIISLDGGDIDYSAGDLSVDLEDTSYVETSDANWRQLTVMFCDLVGSTELSQHVNPEKLREINRAYQDLCTETIETYEGYVARYMGDGVLAYFGYPQAYENDAERAVLAGLDLIEAMKSFDADSWPDPDLPPQVRVGIATGPVVVGDIIGEGASQESAVVGETPNLAARLQGVAEPGSIVISSATRQSAGSSILSKPLGQQTLKGFKDSIEPWRVTGASSGGGHFEQSVSMGLGRFVGRTAEMERLENDWLRVCNGEQVMSLVTGEAGIGKSRLVYEFLEQLTNTAIVLQGHCISHGSATPFLPFIDMLRRKFGTDDVYTDDALVNGIESGLHGLGLSDKGHLPFLLNLFGTSQPVLTDMDTGLIALRTREAIAAVIRAFAETAPTLLFINDCHWMDSSSEQVLDVIARSIRSQSLLTLCTARNEYEPSWLAGGSTSRVVLQPFSPAETKVLLSDRIGSNRIEEQIYDELYDRSGGNPFFAEELARHMREIGEERSTVATIAEGVAPFSVPKTLEGLLLNRVDRLDRNAKVLLQAASVIGRRFPLALAARVSNIPDPGSAARALLQHELLIRDASVHGDSYLFKHALVQDAVYGSLLSSDRKALHRAIAAQLEQQYAGRDYEVIEEIAQHCIASDNMDSATRWTARAGEKALGLFAIKDALSWFGQSLELMRSGKQISEGILGPVLVNQMESLCWDIDYPAMLDLADQHLHQVRTSGDLRHVSRAHSWLADAHINTGSFREALADLKNAQKIADELGDLECQGYAQSMLIWLHAITFECGRADYAQDNMEQVLAIADELDDRFLKVLTYYSVALDMAHRGRFDVARNWAAKSITLGEEADYPPALTYGYCVRAFANMLDEKYDLTVPDAHEAVRIAACKYDSLMSKMTLGSALVLAGNLKEGMAILEQANGERESLSMIGFMYWPDVVYGLGLTLTDQSEVGTNLLESNYRKFLELGNPRAAALAAFTLGRVFHENRDTRASIHLCEAVDLGQRTAMEGVVNKGQSILARYGSNTDNKAQI